MDKNNPRVTIGLPVYNAEKYLEQALDSLLAQTFSEFEIIISDNASTDRTLEICKAYEARDRRVHVFQNEKNLGVAPNFNRVFNLSSTEYFKWAPYDDLITPDFLSRCLEVLDRYPEVVLCYARAIIIDEEGEYVVDYNPGPDTSSRQPRERFRNLILHPEYAIQQMGMIRSEALKNTALLRSFPSSDEVLLAELALNGQFYEIPERLYIYRRHQEQSTKVKKQRDRMMFFDTTLTDKIVLPTWLYFLACLDVIHRSKTSGFDRFSCYLSMVRWLLVPSHFRAMGKDLLIASSQIVSRFSRRSRLKLQQDMRKTGMMH